MQKETETFGVPCRWRTTTGRLPLLGLVCSLAMAVNSLTAADAPPEVSAAASNGLPVFLAKVPPAARPLYGFALDADFSQASLGAPLLLHTIKPSALSSNQANDTVSSVVSQTPMWFFPVMMGTEVKAMLVVDRQDNEWKAVSLGYAPLAGEWNQVLSQWPAAKGFHPRLVAVFQAAKFYFTVPEVSDRNLTPLLSPRNTGPSAKTLPPAPAQNAGRYSTLGNCSNEMDTLKTRLQRADLKGGGQF
jgi:hypothetical protein